MSQTALTPRSRRRSARVVGVVAAMLAVVMPLSGCASWFSAPVATSEPTGESVVDELAPLYSQVLSWTDCGNGMECSTATAPLSWGDPTGDTIDLALVRQSATSGTALGSLLVNPGGPGGSGYDFVYDTVDSATSEELQANFDIVGFDPRGVGRSSAISCYSDPATLDSYIFDIFTGERGSDEWLAQAEAANATFGAECLANTGELLGNVDTTSAARDLDLLRAVLGDEKLNYLGFSYGTELGQAYADLFPDKTGRLVFDGAVDPTASSYDVSSFQAQGFESALRAFLEACPSLDGCPFRGSVDQSMTTIRALLDSLDASPIRNADGRELGANTMFTAIILPLYNEGNWPTLASVFEYAMAGDPSFPFVVADAYYDRAEDGSYSSNSTEAFTAINCLDYPIDRNVETMRAEAAALDAAAPVLGHLMAWGGTSCYDWPYEPTGTPEAITAAGSTDILVVGTTNDPATPYRWAQAVAEQLENGHLVTYTGEGHTAYNSSNDCILNTVDDYFINGTVPATDPQC
jgi:pimeloyl-ACP methyl ester carboxylesterase